VWIIHSRAAVSSFSSNGAKASGPLLCTPSPPARCAGHFDLVPFSFPFFFFSFSVAFFAVFCSGFPFILFSSGGESPLLFFSSFGARE
jgi:hypothetical protein